MARYRRGTRKVALLALACTVSLSGAATIRVPGDAATIQDALDRASAGDTVLVAPGEYVVGEALSFNRTGAVRNVSLIAEAGPAQTTIRMSDGPTNLARGSVIAFEKGETAASVLQGFTLTGGRGMQNGLYGGGIFVASASAPTIVGCIISGNRALHGGGVYAGDTTAATFTDCVFADNTAPGLPGSLGYGGALQAENATVRVTGCSFERNAAEYGGGAVCAFRTNATFTRCEFRENRSNVYGGALLASADIAFPPRFTCRLEDTVLADNIGTGAGSRGAGMYIYGMRLETSGCAIERNRATVRGGGIHAAESHVFIENSRIAGNESGEGGGLAFLSCGAGAVTNCVLAGNCAATQGGGVHSHSSALTFSHCTIAGNVGTEGGGCRILCSRLSFADCIVWDNAGSAVNTEPEYPCSQGGPTPTFEACTMESARVWPGSGNSNGDPRFIGWGARADVYVDASAGAGGDGTPGSPYRDIASACDGED